MLLSKTMSYGHYAVRQHEEFTIPTPLSSLKKFHIVKPGCTQMAKPLVCICLITPRQAQPESPSLAKLRARQIQGIEAFLSLHFIFLWVIANLSLQRLFLRLNAQRWAGFFPKVGVCGKRQEKATFQSTSKGQLLARLFFKSTHWEHAIGHWQILTVS